MGEEIRIEKDRRQTNELKENIDVHRFKIYKKNVYERKEIMKKEMNTGSSRKLQN